MNDIASIYRRQAGEVVDGETGQSLVVAGLLPLAVLVDRIKLRIDRMRSDWLDIGRDLIAAGELVPKGEWGVFLRDNFGWGEETARVFIRATQFSLPGRETSGTVMEIEFHALQVLGSPATPQAARDEALDMAASGKRVTKAKVDELVAKARAAEAAKAEKAIAKAVEATRAGLQKQIDAVEQRIAKAKKEAAAEAGKDRRDRLQKLGEELAELRNRQRAPEVGDIVTSVCRMLKVQKLSDEQMSRLAAALGMTITMKVGKAVKRFEPITPEQSAAMRERLGIATRIAEGIAILAGAPPAESMATIAFGVHRNAARVALPGVIAWAQAYLAAIGPEQENPRNG